MKTKTTRWYLVMKQVFHDSARPLGLRLCPALKSRRNRILCAALLALGTTAGPSTALAANILWVSDTGPLGFSGPGVNATDQGFITLLQAAGHNVNRFNGPDTAATLLSSADLVAINTNDLP
jgi:hypothetical protein